MSTRPWRLILVLGTAMSLAACTPTPNAASTAAPPSGSSVSEEPAASESPSSASSSPSLAVGQTDTDWGRIWDTVPAGFPRFPGSTVADDASPEPASARFAVPGGDAQAIATWFQDALETASFDTVGSNGPAEDGSFVIDSVGEGECRVQTTIAPLGDTTFITTLYGAGCPTTS
jgi:hypothetical protein